MTLWMLQQSDGSLVIDKQELSPIFVSVLLLYTN